MPRNQWNRANTAQPESRVSNPFGAVPSSGTTFGSTPAPVNPFQQQQRVPSHFAQQKGNKNTPQSRSYAQPDRSGSMMGDDGELTGSAQQRVGNPFASFGGAQHAPSMSLEDAIKSYKNEVRLKHGYPFSCLGSPDTAPILGGDISPAELRWYLSRGDVNIQRLIGERASLLNEDYSDFLRGACGEGVSLNIQRVGPYRIPDAAFPGFVPRGSLRIVEQSSTSGELNGEEWRVYESERTKGVIRIPRSAPPLEFR